jgi:putative ABC transport system permease protein
VNLESVRADLRFAFRYFARHPLSATMIVLILALGIGGHVVSFSLVRAFFTRPPAGLPTSDKAAVRIRGMERSKYDVEWQTRLFSYPELRELTSLNTTFSAVAGWTESEVTVDLPGVFDGEPLRAYFVTDAYFTTLGLRPTHGPGLPRTGDAANEAQLVGVITDAMWEVGWARSEDVSTGAVRLNGVPVRIVGVAPPRFKGTTQTNARHVMWLPLSARAAILGAGRSGGASGVTTATLTSRDTAIFDGLARLRPGVNPAQASAAVRVVADRAVAQMTPRYDVADSTVYDADVVLLRGDTGVHISDAPQIATMWIVVTTLILLVACTNVSALVVSAAVGRQREIAVRLSLGASRARLIRQLLTESILLATLGAALSLVVYWLMTKMVGAMAEIGLAPDLGTVAFAMCVGLGTGIIFGLTPALHATRAGVATALKEGGAAMGATRRSVLQHKFVIAQVMFTQPLLLLIGMILGKLVYDRDRSLPAGIPERVLELRIDPRSLNGTAAERNEALDRLTRRIGELPGVVKVIPDAGWLRASTISVRDEDRGRLARAADPVIAQVEAIRPGYFAMLDVPLLRGTDLPGRDSTDQTLAIVIGSELARELWGDMDPIGRRFEEPVPGGTASRELVVTGVYDSRYVGSAKQSARIFRPRVDRWPSAGDITHLIRTAGPASELAAAVRGVVRAELPTVPIDRLATLAQTAAEGRKGQRKVRLGAAGCAGLALLLSSIGLYGAVALAVGQRRREIGIRMALGAKASQVVGLFYTGGVRLGAIGLALGLPLSVVAVNLFASQMDMEDVSAPLVAGVIAGVVMAVASIATLVPATRAATVNPVSALRSE